MDRLGRNPLGMRTGSGEATPSPNLPQTDTYLLNVGGTVDWDADLISLNLASEVLSPLFEPGSELPNQSFVSSGWTIVDTGDDSLGEAAPCQPTKTDLARAGAMWQ